MRAARCIDRRTSTPARGFTLIEVLVVIVVIGIAAVTLTMVSARSSTLSATMLREQQAFNLASTLLEEVKRLPFTYCDPDLDSAHAPTALNAAGCTVQEVLGPEGGQTRTGTSPLAFNNVNDYNNFAMTGAAMTDAYGNAIGANLPSLVNCTARVAEQNVVFAGLPLAETLRIQVTVTCPELNAPVMVEGIRVRYAPNQSTY